MKTNAEKENIGVGLTGWQWDMSINEVIIKARGHVRA